MLTQVEIKEELTETKYTGFLEYLGFDSDEFSEFNEDIDFDDCSA